MGRKKLIKKEKLANHIAYFIEDNTIYLFCDEYDYNKDVLKTIFNKINILIQNNNISYIKINAKKIEKQREFFHDMGFTLSYYDLNTLEFLFPDNKNKVLYRCYAFITKDDFLNKIGEVDNMSKRKEETILNSNSGYVSNLLLLFGAIIFLCYVCVEGAIYLVK